MLAFVEQHLAAIHASRSDTDIIAILAGLSREFGFRSGYLIEYANNANSALHILDSNADRVGWWEQYVSSGLRTNTDSIAQLLARGGVQTFNGDRFARADDPMLAFARRVDMVECTLVPVSHDGNVVGLAGFSGQQDLSQAQQISLQLLVYSLFAQTRSFRSIGIVTAPDALTPREKEVINLSAQGLTSQEIAERLGMAARTVNQHVDNVADKLGTKNRAHTVAEAIRHGLL